jgi:hypothetical protein
MKNASYLKVFQNKSVDLKPVIAEHRDDVTKTNFS